MIRTQIQLSEEQANIVKAVSADQGISISEVVRRAIDSMGGSSLRYSSGEKRRLAMEVVGKFSSGAGDVSEKHDEYLAEAFEG